MFHACSNVFDQNCHQEICSWKWKCYVKNVCFFLARFHTADSIYSKMRSENVSILLDVLSPKRWKCFAGTQNALKMFRASSSVFNTNHKCFCIFRMRFIKPAIKKFVFNIIGMARNAGFCWKVCILSTCIQSTTCPEHVSVWLLAWNFIVNIFWTSAAYILFCETCGKHVKFCRFDIF